jgi:uncharacterized protein YjiS (DUF1127 family)
MRHRDRRAAAGLRSLSDATLRDIGLHRTEVPSLIHAPGAGRRSRHVEG